MPASRITMKAAALVSAAVLMCTSLAACAPKNASSTQSSSKAGTVTVGLPGSLSTLDTAHETGIINYYVAQVTSEGLLAVDKDGKLVPAIATAYHTDDAKTWVFQIRQDAKFQDGNPVKSRLLRPCTGRQELKRRRPESGKLPLPFLLRPRISGGP